MKIPSFRSTTVDEYRYGLDKAFHCKVHKPAHEALSLKTREKFAYIANRKFGFGLGTVFTGPLDDAPVLKADICRSRIESLRNTIIKQQEMFHEGTRMHWYLTEVLGRLPKAPQLVQLYEPALRPILKSETEAPKPTTEARKVGFAEGVECNVFADTIEDVVARLSVEQKSGHRLLGRFRTEHDENASVSAGELRQLWEYAVVSKSSRAAALAAIEKVVSWERFKQGKGAVPPMEVLVQVLSDRP
ncbi:hypothetical protein [Stenotrophomonas sp.]|uniref:hypothetical protein n=1 Tax=Stenotrophomonas sp. TaxID=69392 RepID=UPI0028ABF759|nr:hypothetical protein [Stenotrophomonas sp.]